MSDLVTGVRRLAKVALSCLWLCGQCVHRLIGQGSSRAWGNVIVLAYHGVTAEQQQGFARQLEMVRAAGVPVSLADLPCAAPVRRALCITFDDGFANLVRNVLPALMESNVPGMVFLPSGNLGRPPAWQLAQGDRDAEKRVMTAEEVRAVIATGLVTIGSHTVSHRALTALSESDLDHELCVSRGDLETLTGHQVNALAFPYGAYDERVLAHAGRSGYRRAFSIEPTVHRADADEFLMGRVRVEPDDWPVEVWLKLRGGYQWLALLHRLRPSKRGPESW